MTIKRKRGRPNTGTIKKSVRLTQDRWQKAERIGGGKQSAGIAKALDSVKEDL